MRRCLALAIGLTVLLARPALAADLPSPAGSLVFSIGDTRVSFERSWITSAALGVNWSQDPRHNQSKTPPVAGEIQLAPGDVLDMHPTKAFALREAGGMLPRLIVFSPVEPEFSKAEMEKGTKRLKDAQKSHAPADKSGFWASRDGAYVEARPDHPRPSDQRLQVFCNTDATAAPQARPKTCYVGFYWNAVLSVRYYFDPADVPKREWKALDKRVLGFLEKIIAP